jgi:hypothetical protein
MVMRKRPCAARTANAVRSMVGRERVTGEPAREVDPMPDGKKSIHDRVEDNLRFSHQSRYQEW